MLTILLFFTNFSFTTFTNCAPQPQKPSIFHKKQGKLHTVWLGNLPYLVSIYYIRCSVRATHHQSLFFSQNMLCILPALLVIDFHHVRHSGFEIIIILALRVCPLHLTHGIDAWQHHIFHMRHGGYELRPQVLLRAKNMLLLLSCEFLWHWLKRINRLHRQIAAYRLGLCAMVI